jgi:cutinase
VVTCEGYRAGRPGRRGMSALVIMRARQIAVFLGAAMVATWAMLLSAPVPSASAQPCPDVEVVFARATTEPPGVGGMGQAFVDSLRSQVGGRSVGVYPVNYPATEDWAPSASAGASDASAHVQSMAANCPNTRMVLGGFSQGAVVIDVITSAAGVPLPFGLVPAPMPPKVADHVAAVAVFGNPSSKGPGGPLTAISPLYGAKAVDLCMPGDPVCSDGVDSSAHQQYGWSGFARQAATFAASRL